MNIIPQKNDLDNPIIKCCAEFFKRFKIGEILRRCGCAKRFGVPVSIVFLFILGLVFEGKSLRKLNRHYKEKMPFSKDLVYRCLSEPNVNWEGSVWLIASNVIPEIKKLTSEERKSALIIDDTAQYRDRSKKVEMLARCYDHSEERYYRGHTLLTMAWSDGQTLIPVDYRVVSASEEKNLLYGSDSKEDNRTISTRRRKDARRSKPSLALDMLRNVKGTSAECKYVMFDSWYTCPATLLQICGMGFDVVARLKNDGTKYLYQGERCTLKQLYSASRKRRGRAKNLLCVEVAVLHEKYGWVQAKIAFVRNKSKRKEWLALISTDLSLDEKEIVALYGKRWDIEVFFKVCKTILKLGKEYQCRSFDATSALVAVTFIRYMKLALDNRESRDVRSFGDLFIASCKELEDISFAMAFALLMEAFAKFIRDHFSLSDDAINSAINAFISALPPQTAHFFTFFNCET